MRRDQRGRGFQQAQDQSRGPRSPGPSEAGQAQANATYRAALDFVREPTAGHAVLGVPHDPIPVGTSVGLSGAAGETQRSHCGVHHDLLAHCSQPQADAVQLVHGELIPPPLFDVLHRTVPRLKTPKIVRGRRAAISTWFLCRAVAAPQDGTSLYAVERPRRGIA